MRGNWSLGKARYFIFGAIMAACAPSGGELRSGGGGGNKDAHVPFEDDFELDAGGDSPFLGDSACAAVSEQANETPLSLYVMFDRSNSMAAGKWESATAGLKAFLKDPKSDGITIGLKFFPRAGSTELCSSAYYMTPDVDFGLLPAHMGPLVDRIDNETPSGFGTPIYPALGGALRRAMALAKEAKDEKRAASFAVLLVTDGAPEPEPRTCSNVDVLQPEASAELARQGADHDPPVRTFVVGLPGVNQDFANLVAHAGGTEKALFVNPNDVERQFQKALADVRGKALPCEFAIPEKVLRGDVAISQVNVVWTHGGSNDPETIPQTKDCAEGGWQYDDPTKPSKILLCPSTCAAIKDDLQAKIDIELGCATIVR